MKSWQIHRGPESGFVPNSPESGSPPHSPESGRSYRRLLSLLLSALLALAASCKDGDKKPAAGTKAPTSANEPAKPEAPAEVPHQRFATLAEAVRHIVGETEPRIIGVGEFHQTKSSKPVMSSIERFTADLDVFADGASDLIVETWVQAGKCGEQEETVHRDVAKTTERPAATENHLMAMINGARKRAVQPHVMVMQCTDYDHLLNEKQEVDYEKMLTLIKSKLAELAGLVWNKRLGELADDKQVPKRILLYGGALHNDLHPTEGLEDMSYAQEVVELVGDGYLELDIYVPEYIKDNALVTGESWYATFVRHASAQRVLVFQRSPRSYVVILRTERMAAKKPLRRPNIVPPASEKPAAPAAAPAPAPAPEPAG